MEKLTALELLNRIKEGNAPVEVEFDGWKYSLTKGDEYVHGGLKLLLNMPVTTKSFIEDKLFTCRSTLLTEEERQYIRTITQKMQKVYFVTKLKTLGSDHERLCIRYEDPVLGTYRMYPECFEEGTWFRGLERLKEYSLKELLMEDNEDD